MNGTTALHAFHNGNGANYLQIENIVFHPSKSSECTIRINQQNYLSPSKAYGCCHQASLRVSSEGDGAFNKQTHILHHFEKKYSFIKSFQSIVTIVQ